MSLIKADRVSVQFNGATVLQSVSFAVERGEILTIVGPNGSGKSTLLKALIGAVPIFNGSINRKKGLTIGYVPQKLSLDTTLPLTVARFLKSRGATDSLVQQCMTEYGTRQMSELSGGQLQRVLLAKAIMSNPDLLLLDEATQGLDQSGAADFYTLIEQVRKRLGCAIVMVSHELHVVMRASDRVICLNGHICCHGTPEVVASAPEYLALFGPDTQGALALYRHEHDHHHHGHD